MRISNKIRMRRWAKKNNYQMVWDNKSSRWGAAKNGDITQPISPMFDDIVKLQDYLIDKMYEEKRE